jgi:hypothetical protein
MARRTKKLKVQRVITSGCTITQGWENLWEKVVNSVENSVPGDADGSMRRMASRMMQMKEHSSSTARKRLGTANEHLFVSLSFSPRR